MSLRGQTLAELVHYLAPDSSWRGVVHWPPDAFAITGAALSDSGAYRLAVSPAAGMHWPPPFDEDKYLSWAEAVRALGIEWAASTGIDKDNAPPDGVTQLAERLDSSATVTLSALCDPANWSVTTDLLWLFAAADEACAGVRPADAHAITPFHFRAAEAVGTNGSMSTLSTARIRVLPKLRVPESGITVRSLSRYAAFHRSEVDARWASAAAPPQGRKTDLESVTLLVVPWPPEVYPTAFTTLPLEHTPITNMDSDRFGFFQFAPGRPFDAERTVKLVRQAQKQVGSIDIVVLPEGALELDEAEILRELLLTERVDYLVAGVRKKPSEEQFGLNYAYIAGRRGNESWHVEQHKHHRWFLDRSQIQQYHLGSALTATRKWWEAIDVRARSLTFVEINNSLVVCPLICEDLARPDPVADIIRSVGPTLAVALLLDGPQLAARWPARYATVLADDPGSAVLTVSPLGLVVRCAPPGMKPRRVVALWKDRTTGPLEIELELGAEAVAVTTSVATSQGVTADGRPEAGTTTDLFLTGVEQIRLDGPAERGYS